MSKHILFILIFALFLGCMTTKEIENVDKIEISVNKERIEANGIDSCEIRIKMYNKNGTEIKQVI